jgi:sigma-E factor negative regulatory protein RseB
MPFLNQTLVVLLLLTVSANSFADDASGNGVAGVDVTGNMPVDNSADNDLLSILKRMSDADHNQNYQGTFILRKSDNLSTLQVTHGVDENGDWENLQSLSGESKNIYKQNRQVVSVYPERQIVTVRNTSDNHSLHPRLPANLDQLGLFYKMERIGDDRIANHQAVVVDLLPIDQYRYGYRYWVDKNTGMLLRCDVYDEEKSIIEQMMFTSLDYLSEPPTKTFDLKQFDHFKQQYAAQLDRTESGQAGQSNEKIQWAVNRLPKGFMLTQSIVRNSQAKSLSQPQSQPTQLAAQKTSQAVTIPQSSVSTQSTENAVVAEMVLPAQQTELLHMVYSDGLASVSVFIEINRGDQNHLQGASSMGSVNAYGNSLGDYFITVVGEVPANTVRAMAQSTAPIH